MLPISSLSQINLLSALLGSNPLLTQGAGGNISLKEGERLWIKASGLWLSQAMKKNIFLSLPLPSVLERVKAGIESLSDLVYGETSLLPSIETPIHAILPQKLVVHLHMIDAIIHSILPDGHAHLVKKLHGLSWIMVPYIKPGLSLSHYLSEQVSSTKTNIFLLQNHGIILTGDSHQHIISLLNEITKRLHLPVKPLIQPNIFHLTKINDSNWTIPVNTLLHMLALTPMGLKICRGNPLYPDHVVYLGTVTAEIQPNEKISVTIARFESQYNITPKFLIAPNKGIFIAPNITPGELSMIEAIAQVTVRVPDNTILRQLEQKDIYVLAHWDVETKRKSLDN